MHAVGNNKKNRCKRIPNGPCSRSVVLAQRGEGRKGLLFWQRSHLRKTFALVDSPDRLSWLGLDFGRFPYLVLPYEVYPSRQCKVLTLANAWPINLRQGRIRKALPCTKFRPLLAPARHALRRQVLLPPSR